MKALFRIAAITAALIVIVSCNEKSEHTAIPSDKAVEAKVESVLKGMTLKEKAGQMVQLTIVTLEDDTHEALDPAKLDRIIGE
jgi:beta-glucosidase